MAKRKIKRVVKVEKNGVKATIKTFEYLNRKGAANRIDRGEDDPIDMTQFKKELEAFSEFLGTLEF